MQFNLNELRVIGCLIEKSITTPDQYPLSLNALTNACNQKSNREPVLSLTEMEVQETIDQLIDKRLIMTQAGATSRVAKYKHRFCNTEFSDLQLSAQELAIVCVLFLRGPQTPGELRTRTNRLCEFRNVQETEATLHDMSEPERGPLIIKLAREPGRRESRYAHCFADVGEYAIAQSSMDEDDAHDHSDLSTDKDERLVQLEEKIELMQMEIDELSAKVSRLAGIVEQD